MPWMPWVPVALLVEIQTVLPVVVYENPGSLPAKYPTFKVE
jgi:hypothetical protein